MASYASTQNELHFALAQLLLLPILSKLLHIPRIPDVPHVCQNNVLKGEWGWLLEIHQNGIIIIVDAALTMMGDTNYYWRVVSCHNEQWKLYGTELLDFFKMWRQLMMIIELWEYTSCLERERVSWLLPASPACRIWQPSRQVFFAVVHEPQSSGRRSQDHVPLHKFHPHCTPPFEPALPLRLTASQYLYMYSVWGKRV